MFTGESTQPTETFLSLERIVLALPKLSIADPQIIIVSHLTILITKILHNDII